MRVDDLEPGTVFYFDEIGSPNRLFLYIQSDGATADCLDLSTGFGVMSFLRMNTVVVVPHTWPTPESAPPEHHVGISLTGNMYKDICTIASDLGKAIMQIDALQTAFKVQNTRIAELEGKASADLEVISDLRHRLDALQRPATTQPVVSADLAAIIAERDSFKRSRDALEHALGILIGVIEGSLDRSFQPTLVEAKHIFNQDKTFSPQEASNVQP